MATVQENYIGSGICYLNGRDIGNVTAAAFSIDQDTKEKANLRGGGGNIASLTRISSIKLAITMDSFNNDNLAVALRGQVDVEASIAVAAEEVIAVMPGLGQTNKLIDTSLTYSVTDSIDGALVEGTDYEITAAGVLAKDGGAIVDGDTIKVTYQSKAASALEAMVGSGQEFKFVLDGLNDHNGKPSVVTAFRFKPSPTSGLDLIGEDYADFQVEGELLADTAIQTAGKSQFFRRVYAD
jgi:hypothetical protein